MVHAHNPNILEVGAGGCIQSHLQLYSKSEVSLCRPSLCVITIITTSRCRQGDQEFKDSLSYIADLTLVWAT